MESAAKKQRTDDEGDKQTNKLVLYSYWRSSCSYRVRIVLNMKRLPYEYRAVHLVKDGGQHLKEEHAVLHPMREVPVLLVDGATITQSQGACQQHIDMGRWCNHQLRRS